MPTNGLWHRWDRKRLFNTGRFGTTENLLRFMAGTLREAVPKLISLSPTLAEALVKIERTIQQIHQIESTAIYSTTQMTP